MQSRVSAFGGPGSRAMASRPVLQARYADPTAFEQSEADNVGTVGDLALDIGRGQRRVAEASDLDHFERMSFKSGMSLARLRLRQRLQIGIDVVEIVVR